MTELVFFACLNCGAMSMRNFRDQHCRVCGVAMQVEQITIRGLDVFALKLRGDDSDKGSRRVELMVHREPAPHEETEV